MDVEKKLAAKQRAFLTVTFGGPNNYTEEEMRKGHTRLVEKGLDDTCFDAVVENLTNTLAEPGVSDDLVAKATAMRETMWNSVLGR